MTDELTTLSGVGPKIATALEDAGFETPDEVLEADVDELTEAEHIGESTAEAILEQDTSGYKGRPSRLADDDVYEAIMEAAEEGLTYEGIARVAGIGRSTLDDWRREHEEFAEELERQRSIGERQLVSEVRERKPEFILERSYDWIKTERREVEGEHSHSFDAEEGVTAEFVTYSPDDGDE